MKTRAFHPAFPAEGKGKEGMTLRDYFAAMALQGLLAGRPDAGIDGKYAVTEAVNYADLLLAELDMGTQLTSNLPGQAPR